MFHLPTEYLSLVGSKFRLKNFYLFLYEGEKLYLSVLTGISLLFKHIFPLIIFYLIAFLAFTSKSICNELNMFIYIKY